MRREMEFRAEPDWCDSYPESCRCILTAMGGGDGWPVESLGRMPRGGEGGSWSSMSLKLWYVVSDAAKLDLGSMLGG
jgi:hypothetical protein